MRCKKRINKRNKLNIIKTKQFNHLINRIMKNQQQFNRKIQLQLESLNNFVGGLKRKNIPEFENAVINIDYAYKNQNCCFQLILGECNGVWMHGSNVCDYAEMNSYLLGYMRRWENEQRMKAAEQKV